MTVHRFTCTPRLLFSASFLIMMSMCPSLLMSSSATMTRAPANVNVLSPPTHDQANAHDVAPVSQDASPIASTPTPTAHVHNHLRARAKWKIVRDNMRRIFLRESAAAALQPTELVTRVKVRSCFLSLHFFCFRLCYVMLLYLFSVVLYCVSLVCFVGCFCFFLFLLVCLFVCFLVLFLC